MFGKIFKGVKFLYVTVPLKGLLANLGYKQLKQSLEVNKKQFKQKGAMPCVGLVSLKEYLDELKDFQIETYIN